MIDTNENSKSSQLLTKFAQQYLQEQKKKRHWNIFFRFSFLILFILFIIFLIPLQPSIKGDLNKPHTSLIEIEGSIAHNKEASADNVVTALKNAFDNKQAKGIILRINSPGGSPVQSDYIFTEIRRLSNIHQDKKVYAVCVDLCASGAYYVAAGAHEIYANPASLVGSIGVVFNGFGFVDTLKKLGVERRIYTSVKNKAFLDPFSPMQQEQTQKLKEMLNQLHKQFVADVKLGRGKKLKNNAEIFSGLVWTGEKAKQLGLIDEFGSSSYVAREIIKQKQIIDYTIKPSYIERLTKKFGIAASGNLGKFLDITDI